MTAVLGLIPLLVLAESDDSRQRASPEAKAKITLVPACDKLPGKAAMTATEADRYCQFIVKAVAVQSPPDHLELPDAVQRQIDAAGHDFEVVRLRKSRTGWKRERIGTARPRNSERAANEGQRQ